MERHTVSERDAFEMLRKQARNNQLKLVDVAAAVVDSHALLPGTPEPADPERR